MAFVGCGDEQSDNLINGTDSHRVVALRFNCSEFCHVSEKSFRNRVTYQINLDLESRGFRSHKCDDVKTRILLEPGRNATHAHQIFPLPP